MTRGEVWTAASGQAYAGKPRPVVILQDDRFDATGSVAVCPLTTNAIDAPLIRLPIEPTAQNGLRVSSRLMIDKITTVPKARISRRIGRLSNDDLTQLNRAVVVFLGLAGASSR